MNLLSFSHGNRHVNCKTSRSLWVTEICCFCFLKRETLSAVSIAIIDKKNDITKNKTQNIIMKNLTCLTRPSFSILHVWLYPSFSTAYIWTHAHLLPYMFVHELASAFFSCMSDRERPLAIFFYCMYLITSTRSSFSTSHVWSWMRTGLSLLLYVSDHEQAIVFSCFIYLAMSSLLLFRVSDHKRISVLLYLHMSDRKRAPVFFYFICLTASVHLYFSTSYVWPQACTCIFLLHMSDRKRAPVFFYFICLTASAHLYFSTSCIWARACARLFLLFYCIFLLSDQEATLAFFLLYVSDHEPVPVFFHWCLIVRLTMHDWSFVRLFQFHIFDCEFASIFFYCTHMWACIHLFSIHFKGWPLIF